MGGRRSLAVSLISVIINKQRRRDYLNKLNKQKQHPTLAQLVERKTVVCDSKSLGRWFDSGRSDFFFHFFKDIFF